MHEYDFESLRKSVLAMIAPTNLGHCFLLVVTTPKGNLERLKFDSKDLRHEFADFTGRLGKAGESRTCIARFKVIH